MAAPVFLHTTNSGPLIVSSAVAGRGYRRAVDAGATSKHEWWIAEREYARHEARRGRRFAYESLVPARTALVVVDMLPFFVADNPYCRGIVPNIARLADGLRAAGGTVAWVVPAPDEATPWAEEFYGPEVAERYRSSAGTGTPAERLWHEFAVHDGDLVVEKSAASAFFPGRCPLLDILRRRGVDTVLVAGTVTNVCCESSVRDAATLGFRVVLVADATAAPSDEIHNATLASVYRSFGDVRPAAEVLELLASGSASTTR